MNASSSRSPDPSDCNPRPGGCSDDEVLRAQVDAILRSDAHLQNRPIECRVHEGTLILTGQVDCYYHKQIAQTIAAGVDGVKEVVNQLEVVELPHD